MVRSSSVSVPSSSSSTCLERFCARSRTRRGKVLNSCAMGIMRAFIISCCNSLVMRPSCPDTPSRICTCWLSLLARSRLPTTFAKRLRSITNSPTRFISFSSLLTSTRTECCLVSARSVACFSKLVLSLPVGAARPVTRTSSTSPS